MAASNPMGLTGLAEKYGAAICHIVFCSPIAYRFGERGREVMLSLCIQPRGGCSARESGGTTGPDNPAACRESGRV